MKIEFRNELYSALLGFVLFVILFSVFQGLVNGMRIVNMIYGILIIGCIVTIYTSYSWFKKFVYIIAGLFILGGGLGMISVFIFILSGNSDSVELIKIIIYLFHLIAGAAMIYYWNESVVPV